jgi:voltage-gated potassium channel
MAAADALRPRQWRSLRSSGQIRARIDPRPHRRPDRIQDRAKETSMTDQAPPERVQHSNSYNIFILVLTILSLAIMVLLILPLPPQVLEMLTVYDNLICIVFLADFTLNITRAGRKRDYFIGQRGWLDLLGSIPSFGFFRFTALFRLARLSRLARIGRLLGGQNRKALIEDVVQNRGQYATFITILSAFIVLVVASILVLEFESFAPPGEANITTGGDALWWGVVTITTVGYGDQFPVTLLGRLTGVFVMFAGVGIIGALASILASILVPPPDSNGAPGSAPAPAPAEGTMTASVEEELAKLRAEIEALRLSLTVDRSGSSG